MLKRLFLVLTLALTTATTYAQLYQESGYDYYYDYDHRVVVRSCIACIEDYQDLWNGDYVRVIGDYVYIYRNGSRILYGDKIWLEHTGAYTVQRNGYMYLYDSNGNRFGPWGTMIKALWNGTYVVQQSNYWYLYDSNGYRISGIYSEGDYEIQIYWNGYYSALLGSYYYVFNPYGERISCSYSTAEPILMNSNVFKCLQGNSYNLVDTNGNRVH